VPGEGLEDLEPKYEQETGGAELSAFRETPDLVSWEYRSICATTE